MQVDTPPGHAHRSGLPAKWVVWGTTVVVIAALWSGVAKLLHFWISTVDYHYAFLATACCIAWLFHSTRKLGDVQANPRPWILAPLMFVIVIWCAAYMAASDMLQQILIPLILWLAIVAGAGFAAGRVCAQPIACLYLVLPLWEYLVPLLQRLTVAVTESSLSVIGIPTHVYANLVRIPEGTFEIAEGCAGKKYFIVAVTLGVLAGAYAGLSMKRRLVFVAAAAMLALLANWLRVLIVVVAGHATNMRHYLVAKEHLTFGTLVFVVLLVALLALLKVLSNHEPPGALQAIPASSAAFAARVESRYALLVLLPLAMPVILEFKAAGSATARLASLPFLEGDWQGPLPPDGQWTPTFAGRADEVRASYRSAAGVIEIYINVFAQQSDGRELVNFANTLFAPGRWDVGSQPTAASFAQLQWREASAGSQTWSVSYVYITSGHLFGSDIGVQMSYGALRLIGHPASGIIAVASRCGVDCRRANELVQHFWNDQGARLLAMVPASYTNL